ncbi:MAG TPA: SDR family NAD(P)-dependent oxidoreductase [Spirochaetales bacterium]|nr:SDR family NAD(P)-dependent oxidoreductase [Spirochaetales bacterium]
MNVLGKTAVVTGAANGIGKALVTELLGDCGRVFALDRDERALSALKDGLTSAKLSVFPVDLTDRVRVHAVASKISADANGEIDLLINCAGIIQPFELFADTSVERIEKIMNVNFWGTVHTIQAFLPSLMKRPEAHIVNISSMGAFFPVPGQTIYGASKAAVRMLSEGLYAEFLNTNVRVTVVLPGGVNTNIIEHSGSQPNKKMDKLRTVLPLPSPRKVARKILSAIRRNTFRVFLGTDSKILNLANKLFPAPAIRLATRLTSSVLFDKR